LKVPFCVFCLKSGILCSRCQEKIDSGAYSELDIRVCRKLIELESRFPELKDVEFVKSLKAGGLTIIVVKAPRGFPRRIWYEISRLLRRELGSIRIIEKGPDIKSMVEQLLSPVKVMSIATVWFPDGSSELVIKISRYDSRRLFVSKEDLEKVVSIFAKMNTRIEYV